MKRTSLAIFLFVFIVTLRVAPVVFGQQGSPVSEDRLPGNVVDISSGDHFFTARESIPAGLTTFRLRQVGEVAHELSIVRIPADKTFDEFVARQAAGQATPWAVSLGGPGFIDPPLFSNATLVTEPGIYAMVCFFTPPENPPEHRRMIRQIQVVASPDAPSREPPADLVVRILDDGFEFSPALAAGQHVLRVENATSERRFIRIERLLPGRTVEQALNWGRRRLTVPETERPSEPKGRLAGLGAGQHLIMTVNLQPGTYLLSSLPQRTSSKVFVIR
jgi:hypothetical protein